MNSPPLSQIPNQVSIQFKKDVGRSVVWCVVLLSFQSLVEWQVPIRLALKFHYANINNCISRSLSKADDQ